MRGDSLRDLYAKTLALMGLGVLAGAGALVDFWPADGRLISVSSALQAPEIADEVLVVPAAAREVGSRPVQPVASVALRPVEASRVSGSLGPQLVVPEAPLSTVALQTTITDAPVVMPSDVVSSDPAEPRAEPLIDAPQVALAAFVTEDDEVLPSGFEPWTAVQPSLDGVQASDDPGFLSGALKKTQSLVRTSARTGASIVDAVRVGLGAVRRALPNSRDQSYRLGT